MIFEPLHESNQRGEFFGAMCHWHLRRDGQITIREVLVEERDQDAGIGRTFIERLKQVSGASSIFAKCPANLPANGFYEALGFVFECEETTKSGRKLNHWRLVL